MHRRSTFRSSLHPNGRSRLLQPIQIIFQSLAIGFPTFFRTTIFIKQIVGMHEVRAHIVHVQFGNRGKTHVHVAHHAAGHDTWSLHHAIGRNTELLHVRQGTVGRHIRTGDGANLRHILAYDLSSFLGEHIRRRHVYRRCCCRQYVFLECNQFVQRIDDGFAIRPLHVRVFLAVMRVRQHQRLMVVPVISDFAVLPKQQSSVILELCVIRLSYRIILGVIAVILNHHTGETNTVPFRKTHQIRPPYLRIEFRNTYVVVTFDVFAIARRYRRGKIIQVERRAVNHRIGHGRTEQTECRSVKSSKHLAVNANIAHHSRS